MGLIGIQWLTSHTGLGASSHLESGGFIRSREGLRHPDIQFHFLPSAVIDHGRIVVDREAFQVKCPGFLIYLHVDANLSLSRS